MKMNYNMPKENNHIVLESKKNKYLGLDASYTRKAMNSEETIH